MIKVTIDKRDGLHPFKIDFGYGLPVKNITVRSAIDLRNELKQAFEEFSAEKPGLGEVDNFLSGGMSK